MARRNPQPLFMKCADPSRAEKNENPLDNHESPSSFHGENEERAPSPEDWDISDDAPTSTATIEQPQNDHTIQQAPTHTQNFPQRYNDTGRSPLLFSLCLSSPILSCPPPPPPPPPLSSLSLSPLSLSSLFSPSSLSFSLLSCPLPFSSVLSCPVLSCPLSLSPSLPPSLPPFFCPVLSLSLLSCPLSCSLQSFCFISFPKSIGNNLPSQYH